MEPASPPPQEASFRWLWLGQLISNLGTQCSLYGLGLWWFAQRGRLVDFAAVAFVVQLAKVLVVPLLGRWLGRWPSGRVMVLANAVGALCTLGLAALLLWVRQPVPWLLLLLLALAAMAEAALVLRFASLIPVLVREPRQLAQANGLFATADGLVLSVAPFAGSGLVALAGLPGVLLADGLSFAVAMVCVLAARLPVRWASPFQPPRAPLGLRPLLAQPASRAVLVLGTAMALAYAAIEVLFPAWVFAGLGPSRLPLALLLAAAGYLLGFQLWSRWAWRRPGSVLPLCLVLQSLILMGAGLVVFQDWLVFWYGGLLTFSLSLPVAYSALQTLWQRLVPADALPQLLAQRYRLEWFARLAAFAGAAALVDGLLRPALAWPFWPQWLTASLGTGPGRPLAVGLGAMGWLLLLALCSQRSSMARCRF